MNQINSQSLTKNTPLLPLITSNKLDSLLQPLIREIHLLDTYLAGTTHLPISSVLETIHIGDELILRRDANDFDPEAILVLTTSDTPLGYIPEKDDTVFARLMDAGKILKAKVASVTPHDWYTRIGVSIYLVDL